MKTISVVIPCFNEEKRIGKTLELWQEFLKTEITNFKITEILIVDDGSQDKTAKIAESFAKHLPIKIINIKPNKGKGNAVRTGVKKSYGDLIFVCDADAAALPEEIKKLLAFTPNYDVVIGSRTAEGNTTKMSFLRRVVGLCFHILCLPLIPGIKDASCGAKLFEKDAARIIFAMQRINRFAYDIEILWLAKKMNFKIKEVGLNWQERKGTTVKIFRDGLEMFFSVLKLYKRQML